MIFDGLFRCKPSLIEKLVRQAIDITDHLFELAWIRIVAQRNPCLARRSSGTSPPQNLA